jgi:RimJ/RimL family protein N-acetyltransferase
LSYLIPPERLVTPDFVLRSYEPGDGPLINDAVNSSYDHLKTFMPFARPDTPLDESERRVRQWRGQWLLAQDFIIGIFSPSEDRLLGSTGFSLNDRSPSAGIAELGMWIRADAAGRGLGTAVLRTMLRWGFTEWPWERLYWRCDTRNTASARTAEKAGMRLEGTLHGDLFDPEGNRRDTYYFGLLRDEWRRANPDESNHPEEKA